MGVGTNLGRKLVAGSESCRSVVAGEPLPLPRGELLEEGAEKNEERKKKWGEGEGRKARQLSRVQWPSSTTPTFGKF